MIAHGNGRTYTTSHDRPIDRIVARLEARGFNPKPVGDGKYRSRCPGHDGRGSNLSVAETSDGAVLVHCHRNPSCAAEEILGPLGLELRDLFPATAAIKPKKPKNGKPAMPPTPAPKTKPPARVYPTPEQAIAGIVRTLGKPTAHWVYHEKTDNGRFELMRVYRFDPKGEDKQFRPVHPDADGWRVGDPPGPLPLYSLPELETAETVFVTEGEKAAELVRGLGLTATTSAHGSQAASKSDWSPLAGKKVVILPDFGIAGEGYSDGVLAELTQLVPRPKEVRVLRLPGLKNDGDDVEEWLQLVTGTADRIAAELERLAGQVPPEDLGARKADGVEPPKVPVFSLDLMPSDTFFREVFKLDWLVDGVVVKDEPGAIGGPMKTLKTSILIDLMIALGSATPFLGKFSVPRPYRCCLISGESGRRVVQANARQVCLAREIAPEEAGVLWGFKLPRLTDREHMEVLRKTIDDHGIEVIGLDPFYLTILAGSAGIDTSNMFQMGPLLQDVATLCLEEGCTPIFAHHFTKKRDDPFGSPELTDLAYAGIGQFIRQWMLVAPRESFDAETGKFYLHFRYGGSAGHCGEFALDIEVGKLEPTFDSRKWAVSITSPSQERAAKQEERKTVQEQKEVEKAKAKRDKQLRETDESIEEATAYFKAEPERKATVSRIRNLTGWRADKANYVLTRMEKLGLLQPVEIDVFIGSGASKKCRGYQLVENLESAL